MLTEVTPTRWTVMVNGKPVTPSLPSRTLAEAAVLALKEADRPHATIVPVTDDGKTVLFG